MNNLDKFVSAEHLIKMRLESIPCLIEPLFPKVGLVAIAGSSDTGKSTLMRQLCINIVAGDDCFIGHKLNATHKRAVYVSTEDGKTATSSLLNKQNKTFRYPDPSYKTLNYLFDTSNLLQDLEAILQAHPHDIIVIDAFADIFGKDINQTNQVRSFLNDFSVLAEKYECLIVFVHHTGKASEAKAPHKNNLLGSQGFEAKMRMVAMLTKHPSNIELRYFCIVKGNYIAEPIKNKAIELLFDNNMTFSITGRTQNVDHLSKDGLHKHQEDQIIHLLMEGKSQSFIAKTLGLSQSTVSRLIATTVPKFFHS